jgi:hypothetical protein
MDTIPWETVITLLEYGVSGFCVIFLYLGYNLLRKEQKKDKSDPKFIYALIAYLFLCFLSALLIVGANVSDKYISDDCKKSRDCRECRIKATMLKSQIDESYEDLTKEKIKNLFFSYAAECGGRK